MESVNGALFIHMLVTTLVFAAAARKASSRSLSQPPWLRLLDIVEKSKDVIVKNFVAFFMRLMRWYRS